MTKQRHGLKKLAIGVLVQALLDYVEKGQFTRKSGNSRQKQMEDARWFLFSDDVWFPRWCEAACLDWRAVRYDLLFRKREDIAGKLKQGYMNWGRCGTGLEAA